MKHSKIWTAGCALVLASALLIGASKWVPMQAQALTSDDLQSQIDTLQDQSQQIQDRLAELEQQKQENTSQIESLVEQKGNLEQQVNLLRQQIANNNSQITAYTVLISENQDALDQAQARFQELNEKNKERIRAMEENGRLSYWSVLFKASSFSDFLDRLNMVQEIAASDQRRLDEMDQAAKEVAQAREDLVARKDALVAAQEELAASQESLEQKQAEAADVLEELVQRGDEYRQLIADNEQKQNDLLDEIARKEVERTQALQDEWNAAHPKPTEPEPTEPDPTQPDDPTDPDAPTDPTEPEPTTPDVPDSGGWLMPCSYVYVSSPYSEGRMHPILGYSRPHHGVDLAANEGNPVYASRSGTVTVADYEYDGAGNYVFINHYDGFSSVYMHMLYYIVEEGEYVEAGQVIGYVGSTGLSEGPHLHFGITYNGSYVNPANYISF